LKKNTERIDFLNKYFPIWNQELSDYERRSMLSQIISDVLKKRGLSIRKASTRIPVSFSHFAKIVRGDTAIPQPPTLDSICDGLNLQYSYIFAITGWFKIFVEDDVDIDNITQVSIRAFFEDNELRELYAQCIDMLDFDNNPDFGLFFLDALPNRFYSNDTPNFARKLRYFKKAVEDYIDFVKTIEENTEDVEYIKKIKEPSYFFEFTDNSFLTLIESGGDLLPEKDEQKRVFQTRGFRKEEKKEKKELEEKEEKEEKNKIIIFNKKEVTKPVLELKPTQYGHSIVTILIPDSMLFKFIADLSELLDRFNGIDDRWDKRESRVIIGGSHKLCDGSTIYPLNKPSILKQEQENEEEDNSE